MHYYINWALCNLLTFILPGGNHYAADWGIAAGWYSTKYVRNEQLSTHNYPFDSPNRIDTNRFSHHYLSVSVKWQSIPI